MIKKVLPFILIGFLSAFLLQSCGGSRNGSDDGLTEEEKKQQQELDEIESLLGISPDQKQSESKSQGKQDEKLGLLQTNEVPAQTQAIDDAKLKKLNKEITDLKSQVTEKELIISDLKSQLSLQSEKLDNMTSRGAVSSSASFGTPIGDVAPGEYQQRYQDAYDSFQAHEYGNAITLFESLLASDANNSLADNAQYWIGESHYALRQYDKAIIDFEKVSTFPKSNKLDAAQFKLGLCYVRLGDKAKAKEEFQRLIDLYPKSEFNSMAQKHLQTL